MAPQAIPYQKTAISAERSASAVGALVRRYGGSRFEMQWDTEGNPTAVRFALRTAEWGDVPVRLVAKTETIIARLRATRHFSEARAREQAHRIAWRIIHDTAEQLLLQVSLGMADTTTVFMDGLETEDPETGGTTTMGELLRRHLTLAPGGQTLRLLARPS
jgi:hypothetical protein